MEITARENVFKITHGLKADVPQLTDSIGVACSGNTVNVYFKRNNPLPCKDTKTHRTTIGLKRDTSGTLLKAPIVTGESPKADRNTPVGEITIEAEKIRQDLPIGTEVQVTIEVDQSTILSVTAYVPFLDQKFDAKRVKLNMRPKEADVGVLNVQCNATKASLQKVKEVSRESGNQDLVNEIHKLEEDTMSMAEDALKSAKEGDNKSAERARNLLNEVGTKVDELEAKAKFPQMEREAKGLIEIVGKVVNDFGDESEKSQYGHLVEEVKQAMAEKIVEVLESKLQGLRGLALRILFGQFWYCKDLFNNLREKFSKNPNAFKDKKLAQGLIANGERLSENELGRMQEIIRQLWDLENDDEPHGIPELKAIFTSHLERGH